MLLFHYSAFGLLVDIYKKQKLKEIQEKWNFNFFFWKGDSSSKFGFFLIFLISQDLKS